MAQGWSSTNIWCAKEQNIKQIEMTLREVLQTWDKSWELVRSLWHRSKKERYSKSGRDCTKGWHYKKNSPKATGIVNPEQSAMAVWREPIAAELGKQADARSQRPRISKSMRRWPFRNFYGYWNLRGLRKKQQYFWSQLINHVAWCSQKRVWGPP